MMEDRLTQVESLEEPHRMIWGKSGEPYEVSLTHYESIAAVAESTGVDVGILADLTSRLGDVMAASVAEMDSGRGNLELLANAVSKPGVHAPLEFVAPYVEAERTGTGFYWQLEQWNERMTRNADEGLSDRDIELILARDSDPVVESRRRELHRFDYVLPDTDMDGLDTQASPWATYREKPENRNRQILGLDPYRAEGTPSKGTHEAEHYASRLDRL